MSINHKIITFIHRLLKVAVPLPIMLIAVVASTAIGVYAADGTTDSSAAPNATTSYTLEDIYQRLNTYTHATPSTFTEPSVAPGTGTMHTLNDIYTLLDQRAFVQKTGVTTCYDSIGTLIDCAGTGQDGEYQMGIAPPTPRFVDNGDGTVTDNLTQLIWLQWQTCATLIAGDYDAVQAGIDNLQNGQCNLTDGSSPGDWRRPNIYELLSVLGLEGLYQPLPAPFSGDISLGVFSIEGAPRFSSTPVITGGFSTKVFAVGMLKVEPRPKADDSYGWAVRGGQ